MYIGTTTPHDNNSQANLGSGCVAGWRQLSHHPAEVQVNHRSDDGVLPRLGRRDLLPYFFAGEKAGQAKAVARQRKKKPQNPSEKRLCRFSEGFWGTLSPGWVGGPEPQLFLNADRVQPWG